MKASFIVEVSTKIRFIPPSLDICVLFCAPPPRLSKVLRSVVLDSQFCYRTVSVALVYPHFPPFHVTLWLVLDCPAGISVWESKNRKSQGRNFKCSRMIRSPSWSDQLHAVLSSTDENMARIKVRRHRKLTPFPTPGIPLQPLIGRLG